MGLPRTECRTCPAPRRRGHFPQLLSAGTEVMMRPRRPIRSTACRLAGALVAFLLAAGPVAAQQTTATWLGGAGNYSNATKWSSNPFVPTNNNPAGTTYLVVIDN